MARLANSLITLRAAVDRKFPTRSKASDGWIGDAAHAARLSQHNPNEAGVVCAIDITEDLSVGLDCMRLMNELDASNDPRIYYLIHDHQIDNSDDSRTPYYGPNAHEKHMHISVKWDRPDLYDDPAVWRVPMLGTATPPSRPAPLPAWSLPTGHYYGNIAGPDSSHGGFTASERSVILRLQHWFIFKGCVPRVAPASFASAGWADGKWEAATDAACKAWFAKYRPGQQYTTRIYADDYAHLDD